MKKEGESAPLGIYAKYSSLIDFEGKKIDELTGEIIDAEHDQSDSRLERFCLQSVSRRFLIGSNIKRIGACLRLRQKQSQVSIHKSLKHGSTHYGGLQTCGSVWVCPVCAAKISERRRAELVKAVHMHMSENGEVLLLTLTNPHHLGDVLEDVLDGQKKALVYFNGGKSAAKIKGDIGCIGQVRALEVTHGRKRKLNNGWHPHYHILLFVGHVEDMDYLKQRFYKQWANACEKAGLKIPSLDHGITLEDGSKAAKYASKWGIESELTKGHTKKAKDGETPFDFLRAFFRDSKDKQSAILFKEFAETFKGKRQLHWSAGLKEHFKIDDISDEAIAESQDELADLLGIIELEEWQVILNADMRGELLEIARREGWHGVRIFIDNLMNYDFNEEQEND